MRLKSSRTEGLVMSKAAAAACVLSVLALVPAVAFARETGPADARADLERSCREGGSAPDTCSCLGEFVTANFSTRELEGAALVLSDPDLAADPGAAIGALVEKGYTLDEITAVAERIMALEQAANTACAGGDDAPGASEDE
jgi:hypothetical protein